MDIQTGRDESRNSRCNKRSGWKGMKVRRRRRRREGLEPALMNLSAHRGLHWTWRKKNKKNLHTCCKNLHTCISHTSCQSTNLQQLKMMRAGSNHRLSLGLPKCISSKSIWNDKNTFLIELNSDLIIDCAALSDKQKVYLFHLVSRVKLLAVKFSTWSFPELHFLKKLLLFN